MSLENLAEDIKKIIKDEVMKSGESYRFREPIIGFASAEDLMYYELTNIIGSKQLHPKDILPTAKTVIVYFIPFSFEIIDKIQGKNLIVKEWSDNYTVTNKLLKRISDILQDKLIQWGIDVKTEPPTDNYDPIELTAKWSHKSSAVISGIGTFGLNHLLITKSGTAGRLNSLIIDAYIEPTKRPESSYCLYYKTGKCKVCLEKCPSGALSTDDFDRFRCSAYLDGKNIRDSEQGCGMCSSGPCSKRGF